jgi:BON domain
VASTPATFRYEACSHGEIEDRRAACRRGRHAAEISALACPDTASGLKIDVDTNAGIVTLNGMVATKAEADRAVSLARDTNGVTSVVNNLRIGR